MKDMLEYLKKNFYLVFLLIFVIVARIPMLSDQMIPFQFDHGKDAIGSLHMWQTLDPKLIGPWTSIPGLFFGPAWYYMLLPGMVISQGAPIASVITMLVLGLGTVVLLYVYFGKVEATLFATSSLFYTVTTSAWNPFPMVCVTFAILAVLKHVEQHKKITSVTAGLLAFLSALGFHFSTAFAIFYPVLILASLLIKKVAWKWKDIGVAAICFGVPFIPQALFELKHGFIEVKAVAAYLQKGDSEPVSLDKQSAIISTLLGEVKEVVLPAAYFSSSTVNTIIFAMFAVLFLYAVYTFVKNFSKKKYYLLVDAALWFTVPVLAFTFLHFNVWYLLPLLAFAFILVGEVLRSAPKRLVYVFLSLCFIVSISKVSFYLSSDRENLLKSPAFLPNKKAAIAYVYEKAAGRPFASYHYMPDIYDFPYQYLYFTQAMHGKTLPTEFSYRPGEVAYIPEKTDLLARFPTSQAHPEVIFYIVEDSDNQELYDQWWSTQKYGEVLEEHQISEGLTVFTATPSSN